MWHDQSGGWALYVRRERTPVGQEEKKCRCFSLALLASANHFHVFLRADALLEALLLMSSAEVM